MAHTVAGDGFDGLAALGYGGGGGAGGEVGGIDAGVVVEALEFLGGRLVGLLLDWRGLGEGGKETVGEWVIRILVHRV